MVRKLRVILQPVRFRKKSHVAVICPDNIEIDAIIREIDESHWSTGYKYWHFPARENSIKLLIDRLSEIVIVDDYAIKNIELYHEPELVRKRRMSPVLNKDQSKSINKFITYCELKGYSENTLKVYRSMLRLCMGWLYVNNHSELNNETIKLFYTNYVYPNNYSKNYLKLLKNSINKYVNYLDHENQE